MHVAKGLKRFDETVSVTDAEPAFGSHDAEAAERSEFAWGCRNERVVLATVQHEVKGRDSRIGAGTCEVRIDEVVGVENRAHLRGVEHMGQVLGKAVRYVDGGVRVRQFTRRGNREQRPSPSVDEGCVSRRVQTFAKRAKTQ